MSEVDNKSEVELSNRGSTLTLNEDINKSLPMQKSKKKLNISNLNLSDINLST